MTTEELLKPRYKVVLAYPHSWIEVGEIIENNFDIFNLKDYPKIFKELKWWEERENEDLPKYLKIDDSVRKVIEWDLIYDKVIVTNLISQEERRNYIRIYTPLSEEEYLQFANQK